MKNIFATLRLPQSEDDHRRVLAVVTFLNAAVVPASPTRKVSGCPAGHAVVARATLSTSKGGRTMSIGRWSISHPRLAVAAWLVFVVACVALGAISGTKTLDNGAVGESARGYAIMNKHRLWGPPSRARLSPRIRVRPCPAARSATSSGASARSASHPSSRLPLDRRSALVAARADARHRRRANPRGGRGRARAHTHS